MTTNGWTFATYNATNGVVATVPTNVTTESGFTPGANVTLNTNNVPFTTSHTVNSLSNSGNNNTLLLGSNLLNVSGGGILNGVTSFNIFGTSGGGITSGQRNCRFRVVRPNTLAMPASPSPPRSSTTGRATR